MAQDITTDSSQENTAAQDFGHWLFEQECTFLIGATAIAQVPDSTLPEIAFAGRSNVGKSSLINALTRRKTLARTSNQPGRTQQVNFFDLGNRLILADLPGYGYARAPRERVLEWTKLIYAYLRGRAQLRRTCLLIDARHGLKESDREAMKLLDQSAVPYQIILTKCDKVKGPAQTQLIESITAEAATHGAAHPDVATTSAVSGDGIAELRVQLAGLAAADDIR